MPDAGRQIREIRIPRDIELIPLKNRNEQEQNKNAEKGTKRIGESKKKWKKRKDNEKWSFMKWSLVKITLKHNLGLFILFFETINLGLHYVPEKFILIERGYLDWRVSSLRKFSVINKAVVSFSQPKFLINHSPARDEFLSA